MKEDVLLITRSCLAAACLLFCSTVAAQTTAFGISLGQSTVQDLSNTYTLESLGDSGLTDGPIYRVSGDQIEFDQLNYVEVIFDKESLAIGVLASFPPTKFSYLKALLDEQYEQVSDQTSENGYRLITFKDGESRIELDAPAGGTIAIVYLDPSFIAAMGAEEAATLNLSLRVCTRGGSLFREPRSTFEANSFHLAVAITLAFH